MKRLYIGGWPMKHTRQTGKTASTRGAFSWCVLACLVALLVGLSVPVAAKVAPATSSEADQPTDALIPPTSASDFTAGQLGRVIAGAWRSSAERARDAYRHPRATLQFFGIRPDQTVIEITPGGGWYSAILAPLLHDNGHYIAAVQAPASSDVAARYVASLRRTFAADPAVYGRARALEFDPAAPVFGPPNSADLVLTFRNVHNWVMADTAAAMFKAFHAVLKPGGTLGVVEHRADDDATLAAVEKSGYLPTGYVVKLAIDAGFKLQGGSDINANARDTKNYPKGVWTLPPTYALGDKDRATYQAIGESDRMTLRFVKPAAVHAADPAG